MIDYKTNAFDKQSKLPGIKHPSMVDTCTKHNASVSGSQDESDGEPHPPLPPIKPRGMARHYRGAQGAAKKSGHPAAEKYTTLKSDNSQQMLAKKALKGKKSFHEDLKIDKAKIFKKTFLEGAKAGRKKLLNA